MSLENLSMAELLQEVERRQVAEQSEIRRQLDDARRLVRELEAKLRVASKATSVGLQTKIAAKSPIVRISLTEKTDKILEALAGRGLTGAGELATLIDCNVSELPTALNLLVSNGKLIRSGQRRGTRYQLA